MSTSSPSIDQIISQASLMNSFAAPFDLNTLFQDFDDTTRPAVANKPLQTDHLMHTFLTHPSPTMHSSPIINNTNTTSPMLNTPCLDAFNTPATGFMTDSPMMTTPYMDPLMMQHSAFSSPMIDSTPFMGASNDTFFTPAMSATAADTGFIAGGDDDSLFPPLTNDTDNVKQAPTTTSLENDMDVLFDDLFGPSDTFPSNTTTTLKRSAPEDIDQSDNNKHAKTTATTTEFVCTICQRSFNRRYNLGTHIKTHNKDRIKPFKCSLCPKSFDRKHDCERHLSTVHRGERLFTCHPCGVSFSRRDALHRHQLQKH